MTPRDHSHPYVSISPSLAHNATAAEPTHTPGQAPSRRLGTHTTHWQENAAYGAFQADCGVGAV